MIGKFIKLYEVGKHIEVLINVNHIVAIRDLRSDPLVKDKGGWQWTEIDCTNQIYYKVQETEEEILKLIE